MVQKGRRQMVNKYHKTSYLTKHNELDLVLRNNGEGWFVDEVNGNPESNITIHKTVEDAIKQLVKKYELDE